MRRVDLGRGREPASRPTIVGPVSWSAPGPPPGFAVDTAGRALFMVELATAPELMCSLRYRAPGNYFYGGDGEGTFSTGSGWCVPGPAWAQLSRACVLYYRVVAFDPCSGRIAFSVDDGRLDALPWLTVESPEGHRPGSRPTRCGRTRRDRRPETA